jgi:protein-tyrosine phosphatase
MKVLMVCLGNICRSPIAEGVLRKKALDKGLNWEIDSAGTNGYHDGEHPHPLSQKVCLAKGIDISNQISRRIRVEDFSFYDKIYAMAEDVVSDMKRLAGNSFDENKVTLFLEELHPGKNKNVPDPWYGNEDGYTEVYEMIDKTCDAIVSKYAK